MSVQGPIKLNTDGLVFSLDPASGKSFDNVEAKSASLAASVTYTLGGVPSGQPINLVSSVLNGYAVIYVMGNPNAANVWSASFNQLPMTMIVSASIGGYDGFFFGCPVGNLAKGTYSSSVFAPCYNGFSNITTMLFNNVHQTTSTGSGTLYANWDTTYTLTPSSSVGDLIVGVAHSTVTLASPVGQTAIYDGWTNSDGSVAEIISWKVATSPTTNFIATGSAYGNFMTLAIPIKPTASYFFGDIYGGNGGLIISGSTWSSTNKGTLLVNNNWVTIPASTEIISALKTSWTFSIWAKYNSINGPHGLLEIGEWGMFGVSANAPNIMQYYAGGGPGVNGVTTLVTGVWYHLTYRYFLDTVADNGYYGNNALYLNGKFEAFAHGLTMDGVSPPTIGIGRSVLFGTTRNSNASIGLTTFYNRALTSDEILANYNATKGRYGL